ncbi:MAG: hypothetical protein U9Q37_03065, partial [Euryarchaeota archaeon]|nr:hypothetical protein [Euryarchaeota archaeon]
GGLVVTSGYFWLKQKFDGIHTSLNEHDGFVERTSEDISEMRTDIAILLEKCERSHDDIASIKTAIDNINHILRELSKK